MNLDVIRLDGETQPRESLNDERVDLYAENMKDGDNFPPITVHHDGSSHWLSHGFHRYFAAKKAGFVSIACEILIGTLEDARIYACGANARGGLTPSPADVRRSIARLLTYETSKNWTLGEVARHVGVSSMTVSRVKASLKAEGAEEDTKKTYQRKDGRSVTLDTAKSKTKIKKPDQPQQEEPRAQEPEPPHGDERDHQIAELMDTVTELNAENQRLKDVIATAQWDASDIEKIDVQDTLNELREQIRVMEIDNAALRDSRDMFQTRNAELMKSLKSLQSKLKKLETV